MGAGADRTGFRSRMGRTTALVLACCLAAALPAAPAASAVAAAEQSLTRGNELLAGGEYAAARVAFGEALEADPSSVEAHLGLARAYYGLGEYSRAVIEFEKVLSFDNLPRDLLEQAAVYEQAAEDYAAGR